MTDNDVKQSILAYIQSEKPPQSKLDYVMIAGIVFLGAGVCFAIA